MQTHDDLPHLNTAAGELISVANERAKKYIPLANSKITKELLLFSVLRTTSSSLAYAHKHAEGLFLFNSP